MAFKYLCLQQEQMGSGLSAPYTVWGNRKILYDGLLRFWFRSFVGFVDNKKNTE